MQMEEQEGRLLELQEKLGMMDAPALEARLQAARSSTQQHADRLRALQAEAAARQQQQQQHCQAIASLEAHRQQAQVQASHACSVLCHAKSPSACLICQAWMRVRPGRLALVLWMTIMRESISHDQGLTHGLLCQGTIMLVSKTYAGWSVSRCKKNP